MEQNASTKHETQFPSKEELVRIAARIIGCDKDGMNDFLCLYQWGSRLFGTNESSSDCDMVAVIRGYKFGQLKGKQDHAPYWHKVQDAHYMNISEELIDGINYDVVVYEEAYWQYMLDQHTLWVLPFEFLGDESNPKVLRKTTKFRLNIRWQMLTYQANIDSSKNAKYAKKYWVKLKEYRRAKKRLIYILQHLTFALQIVERGHIYDYTAGNHYHYDIMAQKFPSMKFEEVEEWFNPKMEAILKKLEEICFSFQRHTFTTPDLKPVQMLVEYLRYIGLDQSVKCLSIWPEACNEKHPELVQLLSSRKETPWFVGWCRTCPGLIINKNTFEIVSYSLDNFSKDALELRKTVKFGHKMHINEKLDGVQVTLYWYGDQWHAAAFHSHDQFSPARREKVLECFWSEWHKQQYKVPEDTTKSYIFELIGPQDCLRQIVQYEETQIVLIGVRDLKTLQECELDPVLSKGYGWKSLPNLAEEDEFAIEKDSHLWYVIPRLAADRKLLQRCGLVIRDGDFNRTQEINPGYEALQTLIRREYDPAFPDLVKGFMLTVVKAVKLDEVDRFKAAFPDWVEMFDRISEKFNSFCKKFDDYYKNFEHLTTDKELGGKLAKSTFKSVVFLMRRNNLTAREAFCSPMILSNSVLTENCDKAVLYDKLLHYLSGK